MSFKNYKKNKILNPITNRYINDTPINRKKIEKINKLELSLETNSSKMGPVIYPEYIYDIEDENNEIKKNDLITRNYLSLYEYIYIKKFKEISKSKKNLILSKMEIEDLLQLGKNISEYLKNKNLFTQNQYNCIKTLDEIIIDIINKDTTTIINDLPENKHIGTNKIYSSKYEIRKLVNNIYNLVRNKIYIMNNALKYKYIGRNIINNTDIQLIRKDKEYIDELIKLGIFTYDDLWLNVFKDPKIYDKLLFTYVKYLELYNKLKKEQKL